MGIIENLTLVYNKTSYMNVSCSSIGVDSNHLGIVKKESGGKFH